MATTLRDILVFAPALIGWLVAGYLQFLAFSTLRSPRPGERLFTVFFGELGTWLYTFEGHRYRFWALISFLTGTIVTITLAAALGI
jgi:ABC-type Na+ efflux pump permease subunit